VLSVTLPWNNFPGTTGLVARLIKVPLLWWGEVGVQPAVPWKHMAAVVRHTVHTGQTILQPYACSVTARKKF
jgi:hypothetical protein